MNTDWKRTLDRFRIAFKDNINGNAEYMKMKK
jgi:hypothetical protein